MEQPRLRATRGRNILQRLPRPVLQAIARGLHVRLNEPDHFRKYDLRRKSRLVDLLALYWDRVPWHLAVVDDWLAQKLATALGLRDPQSFSQRAQLYLKLRAQNSTLADMSDGIRQTIEPLRSIPSQIKREIPAELLCFRVETLRFVLSAIESYAPTDVRFRSRLPKADLVEQIANWCSTNPYLALALPLHSGIRSARATRRAPIERASALIDTIAARVSPHGPLHDEADIPTDSSQSPVHPPLRVYTSGALFTTQESDNLLRRFSINTLVAGNRPHGALLVASAYFDQPFLDALHEFPGAVYVVVDAWGGANGRDSIDALREWRDRGWQSGVPREARLVRAGTLFHAKLFIRGPLAIVRCVTERLDLCAKVDGAEAFVGSANATQRAWGAMPGAQPPEPERNEELLVHLREQDLTPLLRYFQLVWHAADELPDEYTSWNRYTLRDFLLEGRLYYRVTKDLNISINPFTSLLSDLRASDRRKLSEAAETKQEVVHSTNMGVHSFDIQSIVEHREEDDEKKTKRVSLRTYGMETCFGVWVPRDYVDRVDADIKKCAQPERKRFRLLRLRLESILEAWHRENTVPLEYAQYVATHSQFILDTLGNTVARKVYDARLRANHVFVQQIEAAIQRLRSDAWVERYSNPYLSAPVPDISFNKRMWEDFVESFFTSLLVRIHACRGSQRKRGIIRQMVRFLEGQEQEPLPTSSTNLRLRFEELLAKGKIPDFSS